MEADHGFAVWMLGTLIVSITRISSGRKRRFFEIKNDPGVVFYFEKRHSLF